MEKEKCKVYIDESGDLGICRGTIWFVLTAVIVKEADEKKIRPVLTGIKDKLNLKVLHFRNIREFNKMLYVVTKINSLPFTTVNVIVDTRKSDLADSNMAYNYYSRILLERVSWYLRDEGYCADVIFSSRNTSKDNQLASYLNDKILNYEWNEIAPGTIMSVSTKKMEQFDMLQFADACAASMFKAYEPDPLGFIYPCFMNRIKPHIYRHNGRMLSYGVKFYKKEMKPDQDFIKKHAPCDYVAKK